MRHYTFETDTLTLGSGSYYWGRYHEGSLNFACRDELQAHGWELFGARITIKFTTRPTPGASTCVVDDLRHAGYVALLRHCPVLQHAMNRKLYWWPEVMSWG